MPAGAAGGSVATMLRSWLRQRIPFAVTVAALAVAWLAVYQFLLYRQNHRPRWYSELRAFDRRDETNPPPPGAMLFVGGSSIRLWETLKRDFTNYAVFRRGLDGAQLTDLVATADRVILPYEPQLVLVYAGDNDLAAGKRPRQVLADFKELVKRIRTEQPEARIAFISIKPSVARRHLLDQVRRANELVQAYTEQDSRLFFIDLFESMLNAEGEPRPRLFRYDGLHLNEQGYRLWADVIGTFLDTQSEPSPEASSALPADGSAIGGP